MIYSQILYRFRTLDFRLSTLSCDFHTQKSIYIYRFIYNYVQTDTHTHSRTRCLKAFCC